MLWQLPALEVIRRLNPDYVCVAWDKPKTNIRKRLAIYPEYKAGRKPPPPDFYEQIPILHDLLDAFGWPLYELDDYEADDIMGTLAIQATAQDIETMLITSDLDMLQMVDWHVSVYALKKGLSNIELYHPESFEAKYGINASQFLDLKALKGDSSDNIPGVPGIGEKGALELLKAHGTLDGVYDNLVLVKETTRKKLEAGKELAYMSKQLASIWTDAPIKLDLTELDGSKANPSRILEILQKLEFRSLVRQLPEVMQISGTPQNAHVPKDVIVGKQEIINTEQKLNAIPLKNAKKLYMHSFSAGKHGNSPLVLALSEDAKTTYVLDLASLKTKVSKKLSEMITGSTQIIGHDLKSTLQVLLSLGVGIPEIEHDIQIGAFLLNPLRRELSITELALADLGFEGKGFEDLTPEEMAANESEIIAFIKALHEQQVVALAKTPKLAKLAKDIEFPVIAVIARMEYEGIQLDSGYLSVMAEQLNDAVSDLEQQIYGYADEEFNIASPAQLADILFNKLKLPTAGIKKGKTSYSTAASELVKLREVHPIIDFVTQFREVTKLKNTYVDTLPNQVDKNSRVHTTFAMTVAQTGRLSSNDPNLQNIPVKTDLGRQIRTAFVAGKGKIFVSADYSQFELRIAAHLSNDQRLIDMFNRDEDVHLATAAEVYDRSPEDVTKNMRREAKVINFGIMYGVGAHGLVQQTSMNYDQAKHFIAKYFEIRPKLKAYIDLVKEQASKDGYVETLFGRRRPTPDVHSSNFAVREAAFRAAVNVPFQGTAADIMKLAMVRVQENLGQKIVAGRWKMEEAPKILLQIHDSLMVECKDEDAEEVSKLLKEIMENAHKLPVKLTVDTSMGKNWGEL